MAKKDTKELYSEKAEDTNGIVSVLGKGTNCFRDRVLSLWTSVLRFFSFVFHLWSFSEILLLGGIFSLGILILVIHLLTWGNAVWEESERLVQATGEVQERYIHSRPNVEGIIFYRPEILISYKVDGKLRLRPAYNRLTLTEDQGYLYNRETVEEILKDYDLGKKIPCWYSIDNPDRVILLKERYVWGWIFLIIPIVLISFGGVGLVMKLRVHRGSEEKKALDTQRKTQYPTVPNSQSLNESPGIRLAFRLPIGLFPTFQFVLVSLLALLWNILSWSSFLYLLSTESGWCNRLNSLLFGLIFCGAGLAFVPWILALFKKTFAIGSTIMEISDHPVIPARKHRLTLIQNGQIKAQSYTVSIVCEEVARYLQGTDTITNRREVVRQPLFFRKNVVLAANETLSEDFFLWLPCGAMHSMHSEHNEIRWKLVIEIVVNANTIFRRECPVVVLPYTIRSDIYT